MADDQPAPKRLARTAVIPISAGYRGRRDASLDMDGLPHGDGPSGAPGLRLGNPRRMPPYPYRCRIGRIRSTSLAERCAGGAEVSPGSGSGRPDHDAEGPGRPVGERPATVLAADDVLREDRPEVHV